MIEMPGLIFLKSIFKNKKIREIWGWEEEYNLEKMTEYMIDMLGPRGAESEARA